MREEHRKNKASAALVLKAMWADIFGKTKYSGAKLVQKTNTKKRSTVREMKPFPSENLYVVLRG